MIWKYKKVFFCVCFKQTEWIFVLTVLRFTNNANNNIEKKTGQEWKIRLYSYCDDCSFKRFSAIDKEEVDDLLMELREKEKLDYYSFFKK